MNPRPLRTWFSRISSLALAWGLLTLFAGTAQADTKTQKAEFKLTVGDFREITFVPSAAGNVTVKVDWNVSGIVGGLTGKDIPLKVELFRPGQSTPVDKANAGSPVILKDVISSANLAQIKGKPYKVKISNTLPGKQKNVTGDVLMTFPIATQTIFQNSDSLNLAGNGAQTTVNFKIPNAPGKLVAKLEWRDGTKELKMTMTLKKGNGTPAVTKIDDSPATVSFDVTPADLSTGLNWSLLLKNNNNKTLKGIDIVVQFTPN